MTGIADYQIVGSSVFHEFTVVDNQLVKVTPWYPPEIKPWAVGRYQGLVKRAGGEKVIKDFWWDGIRWKRLDNGRFTKTPFEWRGLAEQS